MSQSLFPEPVRSALRPGRQFWQEVAIAVGLFALALILRFPNYMIIPPLTDEFKEVEWAISMTNENQWPLVAFDSYDGPLFAYLVSFSFRLFGMNPYMPRLFVLVIGALTVVVTYAAARQFARGDRRVGMLAALLLAANAHHILFNSHVAWSNDTTPFFSTLALLAYFVGTREWRAGALIAAGALYGLALQTHPTVLLLAPGIAADFLLRARTRAWLRRPAPYLAMAAALVAYGPVIYYNILNQFSSLQTAAAEATYAFETQPTLSKSLANVGPLLTAVAQVALGGFPEFPVPLLGWAATMILFWTLTVGALVFWARRREPFALLIVSGALLFLLTFNRFYAIPDSARYYQPLLPVLFSAWAFAGVGLWERIGLLQTKPARWAGPALVPLLFVGLATVSLLGLRGYYEVGNSTGRNNASMLEMVEAIRREPQVPVLIDYELTKLRTGRGGNVGQDLIYWFELDHRETRLVSALNPADGRNLAGLLRSTPRAFVISFPNAPQTTGLKLDSIIATHFPCPSCPVPQEFTFFLWDQ